MPQFRHNARMLKILLINGPNLNLLGSREVTLYGEDSLDSLIDSLTQRAESSGATLLAYQSNAESDLIERLHQARKESVDMLIINAGAYAHTSIALRDAVLASNIPAIEVHITNVFKREPFRHHSYLADIAIGQITGLGTCGYQLALDFALTQSTT